MNAFSTVKLIYSNIKKVLRILLPIIICFIGSHCEARVNAYFDSNNDRVIYSTKRRIDYGTAVSKITFNKWTHRDNKNTLYCVSVHHHGTKMNRAIPSQTIPLIIGTNNCQLTIFNSPYLILKLKRNDCTASYLISEEQMNLLCNEKNSAIFIFTFDNKSKPLKPRKITYKEDSLLEIQKLKTLTYDDFDSKTKLSL